MSDRDILTWLNYWLATFQWSVPEQLCHLEFRDPAGHIYKAKGKDLRDCVANAIKAQPTSCTFIGIVPSGEYTR